MLNAKSVKKKFWLPLILEKESPILTADKKGRDYLVKAVELRGEEVDIIWQDTQRTPFWASENKRRQTLTSLKKKVPGLTPEKFDEMAREFSNADADGNFEEEEEVELEDIERKNVTSGRVGNLVFEEVFHNGKLCFCVWDLEKGAHDFTDSLCGDPPVVYYPLPALDMVKKHRLYLASEPEEYGSTVELAREIQDYLHKYLDYLEEFEELDPWYAFLSWVFDRVNNLPYRRALGDLGTGKTRWALVLGSICRLGFIQGGAATPAAIFRLSNQIKGTQIIDETSFDKRTEVGQAMSQVLNCGYDRVMGVVVRCVGDDAVPTTFDIYGPKLIAARSPFGDEATESRALTHISYRVQRKDIPIDLDEEFWQASLTLRNKLLMWRFRNIGAPLNGDEEFEKTDINPRLKQIMLPLVSLTQDKDARAFLTELASTIDKKLIHERGITLESTVINAIIHLKGEGEQLTIGRIAECVRDMEHIRDPEDFGARKCGWIIKNRLNLERRRTYNPENRSNPVTVVWDDRKMERLALVYGISITSITSITLSGRGQVCVASTEAGERSIQQPSIGTYAPPTLLHNVTDVTDVIDDPKDGGSTVSDLEKRLWDAFGVNSFKPSQISKHFSDDELVRLTAVMDEMRKRGKLAEVPLESGHAWQIVGL